MAVVHYKFKNSRVGYDSITFDGLAISLRDLKQDILRKKSLKADEVDLQVENAQTGEGTRFSNRHFMMGELYLVLFLAISRQRPTTNIKSNMVCVKLSLNNSTHIT